MQDSAPVFGTLPAGLACRGRNAAYAIIHGANGRVAAVCANVRGRDEFWLPGGGMLEGESPEQTIVREVREELGREVRLGPKIGQAIQYFFAGDHNAWCRMTAHFFAARFLEGGTGRGEHGLCWVDPVLQRAEFFHECHVWAATDAASR